MIPNYVSPFKPEPQKEGKVTERKGKQHEEETELTSQEVSLIEGLRDGSTSFDTVQREVASRAFEKILRNPSSLKVKDWLQSELIKIKKEESQARIGAMEVFLRKMFSGNLPTQCMKCGTPLFQEGIVLDESKPNPNIFQDS